MKINRLDLKKLVAVIGGFLIMAGIILLGAAALAISGYLNVGLLFDQKMLLAFAFLVILIGLFDTFSAVIIARW